MKGTLLAAAVALLLLSPAEGTSVKSLSFDDLVGKADRILVGTVARVTCREAPEDPHIRIWTDVRLEQVSVVKGAPAGTVTVSLGGGRVGDRAVRVAGMPRLTKGRRYLLFLHGEKDPCPFLGWGQGVFHVRREDRIETATGVPIREVKAGRIVTVPPDEDPKDRVRLTLTAFRASIEKTGRRIEAAKREAEARRKAEREAREEGR